MKNYIQPGDVVTLTAPANVLSGAGVKVGTLFGVCTADAASGADVEVALIGVYTLPKGTGVIAQGAKVYWDDSAKNVTTTASTNTFIGAAVLAAGSGDATARIRLNGVSV